MQNQNFWDDPYASSGHTEKCWDISDIPDSDEVNNSYIMNSASKSAKHNNETYSYPDSDNISPDSVRNLTPVTDSSIVLISSTDTEIIEKNKYGGMFSNSSSFTESEHSLNCKYSDEGQINELIQSEGVSSSEPSNNPYEAISSLSSSQRCSKRRNSLPPDYPVYKRRLSTDFEVQSLYGTDVLDCSDSNSSYDTSKHDVNEESSWTNCYAPYRKRPTSVISSERGAESLIDKLFSEEQKKRYEAFRKKSSKQANNKRRKSKHINFGKVYKSFVEGVTDSPQNLPVFVTDFSSKKSNTKILENACEGFKIHDSLVNVATKDSQQVMLITDSIPEETDTDLIPPYDDISASANSYHQDTISMDYADGCTDNILIQISSNVDKVYTDVGDNSKDPHHALSVTYSLPEETVADLIPGSDSLSVDGGFTSDNILVQIPCDDKSCTDGINDSKDSLQALSAGYSIPEKTDTELILDSDNSVSVVSNQKNAMPMDYDGEHISANTIIQASPSNEKICPDVIDKYKDSHEALSATSSIAEESITDLMSESDSLSIDGRLTSHDVLVQIPSSADKACTVAVDNSKDSLQTVPAVYSIPEKTGNELILDSDSLSINIISNQKDAIPMDYDTIDGEHTSNNLLIEGSPSNEKVCTDISDYSKDSHQVLPVTSSIPEETVPGLISDCDSLSVGSGLTSRNILVHIPSCDDKECTDDADNSENALKSLFAIDSRPEKTNTDLISDSDSLSINIVSNKKDTIPMDCDAAHTSANLLLQISSGDNRICSDVDNSTDSHQGLSAVHSIPKETSTSLMSESDSRSFNAISNKQDAMSMDYDTADNAHTSENILVQNSSNDSCVIHHAYTDDDNNSKVSQQVLFVPGTFANKIKVENASESDYVLNHTNSIPQDTVAISCGSDGFTNENNLASAISDDNSQQIIFIQDSNPNETGAILNSESNQLSPHVDFNEQDVLSDIHAEESTTENILVKDSQNVNFIADSSLGEVNADVRSEFETMHTDVNQQVVMSMVTNELTSENILIPAVSSDTLSADAGGGSEDSQQIIFITDSISEENDAEIMLESDCLASHTISSDQNVSTINNLDQLTSDAVLVYVPCEGGYRLCKVSSNIDINSKDYEQITFITDSIPNETDSDLIEGSNYYIINTDPDEQNAISIMDNHISESNLASGSNALYKNAPFLVEQNIDFKTETNEAQLYDTIVTKEITNSSVENLTNDEISHSLDKIFTQTTESDVLYSIPEEQREVPFDFDNEKLTVLDTNIPTEASEGTYIVIPKNSGSNTNLIPQYKRNMSSSEYLENKSNTNSNQEDMLLIEENKNNVSVSLENANQILQIESKKIISSINVQTKNVCETNSEPLSNTEIEICYDENKAFVNSKGVSSDHKPIFYEDEKVMYENLCEKQEKESKISHMDAITSENVNANEVNKLLSQFKSTNEISHNIFDTTSTKKVQMNESDLIDMTKSLDKLLDQEIKSKSFSDEHLGKFIENSHIGISDCKDNHLSTSKARKSTLKLSILKSSEDEILKVIGNNIESKESLLNHDNSGVQKQVPPNLPSVTHTLSDSEAENIPISDGSVNFNPDGELKACKKFKVFRTQINGKHRNGTAKKSSKSSKRSSDEMSNTNDFQNSFDSSSDESSGSRKASQYNGDYNNTEMNNPARTRSVVDQLQILHNLVSVKQRTALKTFKKPFTVAKKSITEKSSYKTVFQSYFGIRTAKKTCNKSSNKKLLNTSSDESSSSVEELSADEAKNSTVIWSPVKDLKLKVCTCSAVEIPCICNGEQLQSICEAEDTIDEKIVPCTKSVSQQYVLTPSSEIKHRAFCDIHLWRLRNHHCCPKCGVFCTQGSFLCCSYDHPTKGGKETHIFHPSCFLVPDTGLPPGCPHCCTFSNFKNVHLSLTEKLPEETFTQSLNKSAEEYCITKGLENYAILMKTQNVETETALKVNRTSVPPTQELKTMLMAITKEPSLRLRPTGKCLFNPIKIGDVKKVIQLIANGVDPNHKFNQHKNNTPLHIASFYGSIGIVHILIQYGAFIDAVNDDLETSFILAVEKDQMAVVRYLIHAGTQINVKNENGLTAFHVACKNNSKEMAEYLYASGKFDINLQDDGGWTPLVWACEHNYGDLVQWLLRHGADPNIRDNEQNTALHWAACSGNSEILEMLLDNGCNLSVVNQRGDSALHIAARKDNWTCVKLLLARNVMLDWTNKDGETPLMCCDEGSKSLRYLKKHSLTSITSDNKSFQQYVVYRDISRGSEKYPIQAVNEVDQEEFIMDFRYITRNCFASNVTVISTVDSMQKCYCKDNCSSSHCTCTHISKCWYNMDGCLISDFDMYDPPSLYECNKLCHCPKTCINRVVQKGLSHPLQLFRTLNRGWGIRSLKDLPKGTFVCEYVGEVISEDEIDQRIDDTYLFDLESTAGDNCIDGRFYGNIARFINHSCEPNLVSIRVFIEHQDSNFPRIAFFAMKNIKAFDELCFDYGTEFWVAKAQTILCTCNTSLCKYSKDSIDATLQDYIRTKEQETFSLMDTEPS